MCAQARANCAYQCLSGGSRTNRERLPKKSLLSQCKHWHTRTVWKKKPSQKNKACSPTQTGRLCRWWFWTLFYTCAQPRGYDQIASSSVPAGSARCHLPQRKHSAAMLPEQEAAFIPQALRRLPSCHINKLFLQNGNWTNIPNLLTFIYF